MNSDCYIMIYYFISFIQIHSLTSKPINNQIQNYVTVWVSSLLYLLTFFLAMIFSESFCDLFHCYINILFSLNLLIKSYINADYLLISFRRMYFDSPPIACAFLVFVETIEMMSYRDSLYLLMMVFVLLYASDSLLSYSSFIACNYLIVSLMMFKLLLLMFM